MNKQTINESITQKREEELVFYVDMDNVLVDFKSGLTEIDDATKTVYKDNLDNIPGIFSLMKPMPGAIEAYKLHSKNAEFYILSTAPWDNPSAWSDKVEWVKKYLGASAYKRLILSHHKDLLKGDYLIDDRYANGAHAFDGTLLKFDSPEFPNWEMLSSFIGEAIANNVKGLKSKDINYPQEMLEKAQKKIIKNEDTINGSKICGCTYCGYIFKTNDEDIDFTKENEQNYPRTGHCPKCKKAAVMGIASGYPVDNPEFLKQCSTFYFKGESQLK